MLRQRERAAFVYLYDNYAGALNGVILTIIDDTHFAGDILQEVLVKIWRQIDSYDPARGRLFTWMHHIARNTAVDATRGKEWKTRIRSKALTEDFSELPADGQLGAGAPDLRGSVQQLKEEQRLLVDMSYFQGYTQVEIAEMLGLPLGTVKTRLRSALMKLKKLIRL